MLTTYPHSQPDPSKVAYFGCFHSTGLRFGDYTPSSRALTAANWGNRTIRTATRRRHAGRQLLMLPNPHRCRRGAPGEPASLAAVPAGGGGAWLRCPRAAGPGCGARGRWRRLTDNTLTTSTARLEAAAGPAGPGRASRRRAERSSQRGRRAGGPPPTGTQSSPAKRKVPIQTPAFTASQQHAEKSYGKYESFIGSS